MTGALPRDTIFGVQITRKSEMITETTTTTRARVAPRRSLRRALTNLEALPGRLAEQHRELLADATHRRLALRDEMVTALLSLTLVLGLFLDGWAHLNLYGGKLGAFITPWHAVLYAGFTATAVWVLTRQQDLRRWQASRVPSGYGLSVVGLAISTVGLMGDAAWHTLFGVEEGVGRVLAPFHLPLFLGAALLVGAPLRALWHDRDVVAPSWPTMLPALLSLIAVSSIGAFTLQFASPFVGWIPDGAQRLALSTPLTAELVRVNAVLGVLLSTAVLMLPLLLLLRRFAVPRGTVTLYLGSVVTLLCAVDQFRLGALMLAALVAGISADHVLAGARRPSQRVRAHRVVAVVVPVMLWGTHLAVLAALRGLALPLDLSLGTLTLAVGVSFGLSLMLVPGRMRSSWPQPAETRAPEDNGRRTPVACLGGREDVVEVAWPRHRTGAPVAAWALPAGAYADV